MQTTILGRDGPKVSAIGLGCMGMSSGICGPADEAESIATMVEALRRLAAEKGATPAQLAIAWVRSRGVDIVPLVGARRRDQLKEALWSLDLRLTADDLARIEAALPPEAIAGERYDPTQMAHLDSEAKS